MFRNKLNPLSKMAIPHLNFKDKSFNIHRLKGCPKISRIKLRTFRAIFLSIFLYFAMFYFFRFSPLTLVCTTEFWFFISNTLILIIAADFDAFSSSEIQEYISQEYEIKNKTRSAGLSVMFETTLMSAPDHKRYISVSDGDHSLGPETAGKKIENDADKQEDDNAENPEEESEEKLKDSSTSDREVENEGSTTQKAISVAETDEKLHRESLSDQIERQVADGTRSEEDEFSSMSVEELNTRVEEFIRRIHRQIRLQKVDKPAESAAAAAFELIHQ